MSDYNINILYSDEDGGYVADIPDLDSCFAFGETPSRPWRRSEKPRRLGLKLRSNPAQRYDYRHAGSGFFFAYRGKKRRIGSKGYMPSNPAGSSSLSD